MTSQSPPFGGLGTWSWRRTPYRIVKGQRIYYNFIRPREGLKGETPADRAGIKVEGEDKWLTIIQNATKEGRKAS